MKKLAVLVLVLFVAGSVFAFEQGTKTVGGFIGYKSYTHNSDADAVSTIIVSPHGGYFVIDNLCACLNIDYESATNGVETSSFGLGIGAKYFYTDFYGGAGFHMMSHTLKADDYEEEYSGNYIVFRAGYLVKIAENIYVDIAGRYKMGIGAYGGDWEDYDNEESEILFGGGVDIFFP
jgi:hypothetical protein